MTNAATWLCFCLFPFPGDLQNDVLVDPDLYNNETLTSVELRKDSECCVTSLGEIKVFFSLSILGRRFVVGLMSLLV